MSNQILQRFREYIQPSQFNAVRLRLASAERIKALSYGEVKKIETINYRTLKPEKDGLFCARIFGPVKDWECNCGKYKRMKHRGVTCEKCGVEVIQSRVRRERMGHINLVAPVSHIWYLKGTPSYLSLCLDLSAKNLERIIYFDSYISINQGNSPFNRKTVISSADYEEYLMNHPEDTEFKADSGAEAIRELLKMINLADEIGYLREAYANTSSVAVKHKIMRRIKVLSAMKQANLRPEWMILDVLPVLPPDLRPLVPLEGGRFASSDLNELYRRVLNRNVRLRRLIEIEAPNVIIKNEKRMLQESVDSLIDNGRRGQPVRGSNKRPLKSLSEMLRGKQGRFRQNLLGKRVDYSARSVIIVDPQLKMSQCGLPKIMALELFKSHVYAELLRCNIASNLRIAKKMVEDGTTDVWDALDNVVKGKVVLLNRAPTLHRLGIQAFYPVLVDGKAIKIHPLVCSAFNADFDGDMMAVHLPLSCKAQKESEKLVLATKNLLASSNGRPVSLPSQEIILGLYYMTKTRKKSVGEKYLFSGVKEVVFAHKCGKIDLHAIISLRLRNNSIIETTVGRALLYDILPEEANVALVNRLLRKKDVGRLVENVYYTCGSDRTVQFLEDIKKFGFKFSTSAGITFPMEGLIEPETRAKTMDSAEKKVSKIEKLFENGAITKGERENKIVGTWHKATATIAKDMYKDYEDRDFDSYKNEDKSFKEFNPIFMSIDSGARGTKEQIKQLAGMRGLMARPSGEVIETPVKSNFKRGLSVFEYFTSTHGARKGQADTALKTANSGYLTRRLVDVAQDVVVTLDDCQTLGHIILTDLKESGKIISPLMERLYGRVLVSDLKDGLTGEVLLKRGQLVTRSEYIRIKDAYITKAAVRSVLTCQAKRGVCAKCYGMDLATTTLVDQGVAVGVIAAQSIGEPGTQLTMRTFHIGGTASLGEQASYISKHAGLIEFIDIKTVKNRDGQEIAVSRKGSIKVLAENGRELQELNIPYGATFLVKNGDKVKANSELAVVDVHNDLIISEKDGKAELVDLINNITSQEKIDSETGKTFKTILEHKSDKYQPALVIVGDNEDDRLQYYLPHGSYIEINNGQEIKQGDVLVKIPKEVSKTRDITGGLPRVSEIFEARVSKNASIISDIDGTVEFAGLHRGHRKINVISGDNSFTYLIPRDKQLIVAEGECINAGDQLTKGLPVLQDVLRILGADTLQAYIVNQVQAIYRLQGVDIDDRHIEVIAKQMMRKVRVVDPGDSNFLIGDLVDKIHFKEVNVALRKDGKKGSIAKPVLMGITMASLGTESIFSAASFQETTRILSEASVYGLVDNLYGLKENIIVGKLIPAGTGCLSFKEKHLGPDICE